MRKQPIDPSLLGTAPGAISDALLAWYDRENRPLPWRRYSTPYRVWVSEIMLQQTRVAAVLPYFERWMEALPTLQHLAQADPEALHKLWEGLGYYSRVRNLQRAAQQVCAQYGGELPADYQALLTLPGIGEYTAGAIGSIAFGLPVVAVDGNVLRVFARLMACQLDVTQPPVKKAMTQVVRDCLPPGRPGDFNQALMELGATVCLPNGEPLCESCPLADRCRARELEIARSLPVKGEKKPRRTEERTLLALTAQGKVLLRRRPEKGLLAGLWELPGVDGTLGREEVLPLARSWGAHPIGEPQPMGPARHIFTHICWEMTAWQLETREFPPPEGWAWADARQLREGYPLPSAFRAYRDQLLGEGGQLRLF